jgi:hypothetical protein
MCLHRLHAHTAPGTALKHPNSCTSSTSAAQNRPALQRRRQRHRPLFQAARTSPDVSASLTPARAAPGTALKHPNSGTSSTSCPEPHGSPTPPPATATIFRPRGPPRMCLHRCAAPGTALKHPNSGTSSTSTAQNRPALQRFRHHHRHRRHRRHGWRSALPVRPASKWRAHPRPSGPRPGERASGPRAGRVIPRARPGGAHPPTPPHCARIPTARP